MMLQVPRWVEGAALACLFLMIVGRGGGGGMVHSVIMQMPLNFVAIKEAIFEQLSNIKHMSKPPT